LNIAFFDSGIGGLTVLKKSLEVMPEEDYLYFADTENVPYGTKPKEEVKKYVFDAVEFLAGKNIKALVVACNTATSVVIKDLREKYNFPIIGMEPAVKPAIINNSGKKVLVTATSLTLRESKLESLIETLGENEKIEKMPLDLLVTFAEKFDFNSEEVEKYLLNSFADIDLTEYESIVLGCTHFIFYKEMLETIIPKSLKIIDGNEGTIRHLHSTLSQAGLCEKNRGKIEFFASGKPEINERIKVFKKMLF